MTRRSLLLSLPFAGFLQEQPETPECSEFREAFVDTFGQLLDKQDAQLKVLQAIVDQQAKDALVLERIEKRMERKND